MQATETKDFEVLHPGLQGNNKATSKAVQDAAL